MTAQPARDTHGRKRERRVETTQGLAPADQPLATPAAGLSTLDDLQARIQEVLDQAPEVLESRVPYNGPTKLRGDIRAVLPDLKERFEKSGGEVFDLPNDKLEAFVVSEYENWTKLIREAGIKLD